MRIEGEKIYLCERFIALDKYLKGIVWIALQTDTNLVKHAITFGNLRALQLQIIVYSRIYIFLPFKWRIKLRNRLRMQREKNYLYERFITLCSTNLFGPLKKLPSKTRHNSCAISKQTRTQNQLTKDLAKPKKRSPPPPFHFYFIIFYYYY